MPRFTWNARWLVLAFIGIALFFGSNVWNSLSGQSGLDEDMGKPAVSKENARSAALDFVSREFPFLEANGADVLHQTDLSGSSYINRFNLQKQVSGDLPRRHPLDYWQVEVKDRKGKPAATVDVGMDTGAVSGWSAAAGTGAETPAGDQIRGMVEERLRGMGYRLDEYVPLPEEPDRPGLLVYESKQPVVGSAKLKLTAQVRGTAFASLSSELLVPEDHKDWMNRQERQAGRMSFASLFLSFAFSVVALVYAIRNRRDISFSRGWILVGIYLALSFLQNYNTMPGLLTAAGPGAEREIYRIIYLAFMYGVTVLTAGGLYVSLLAGDQLWRERGWNPWPRWSAPAFGREVLYGMGRGYLISLFLFGLQQAIFSAESRMFHSFAVSDPTQSVYNLVWPAFFPLLAWIAAISEEIVFRLFGIILFKKLFRFTFPAVLAPGIVWALGHTGYALYPSYTRLIEVTLLGLVFGYVFLRYGLITALFAHAILDGTMTAISLMVGFGGAKYILIGVFYLVMPALLAYVLAFLHARFRKAPDPLPGHAPDSVPPPRPVPPEAN